jgi:Tfp pilus assembly protein FimV
VRTRIALSTAIAVLVIPFSLFMLFSSTDAGAARAHHEAGTRHRAVKIDAKLTSYSKAHKATKAQKAAAAQAAAQAAAAQKAAQLANYASAVAKGQEETYLKEYAYLKETAYLKAEAAANTMPAAWAATATCEEGGRNDPNYGYFGIKEWNGFDGYATAGSAPLSVQLAWEAAHGQGPPDAPGQCHAY